MQVAKVIIASAALLSSGWCVYDAQSMSRAFRQPQARHRSVEDELQRMQVGPEGALVLWIPAETANASSETGTAELPQNRSPPRKLAKVTSWPRTKVPNLAEAR